MIRTFIALELPSEVRDSLGQVVSGLRQRIPGVRWVRPEAIHVTLKFLGDIEEGLVPALSEGLDSVAANFPAMSASLSGLGAFPDLRRPRVVWAGMTGDTRAMVDLAADVDRMCHSLGMEKEKRPFKPHITIGRLKVPVVLDLPREIREAQFTIYNVILYRSELSPSGARYTALHRSVLGRKGG